MPFVWLITRKIPTFMNFDKYGIIVWVEIPFVDKPGDNRDAFWETTKITVERNDSSTLQSPVYRFWGLQNEVSTSTYNDIMPAKIAEWCAYVKQEDPTVNYTGASRYRTPRMDD